jgi:hypothetical protein
MMIILIFLKHKVLIYIKLKVYIFIKLKKIIFNIKIDSKTRKSYAIDDYVYERKI